MAATKQNTRPSFDLLDILEVCTLPDGRIIIPPDYAETIKDEFSRLYELEETAEVNAAPGMLKAADLPARMRP